MQQHTLLQKCFASIPVVLLGFVQEGMLLLLRKGDKTRASDRLPAARLRPAQTPRTAEGEGSAGLLRKLPRGELRSRWKDGWGKHVWNPLLRVFEPPGPRPGIPAKERIGRLGGVIVYFLGFNTLEALMGCVLLVLDKNQASL